MNSEKELNRFYAYEKERVEEIRKAGYPVILVCGGRGFNDYKWMFTCLDKICEDRDWYNGMLARVCVINGGAKGADHLATDWAIINYCPFVEFKAHWKKFGKKAGVLRNLVMADTCPDLVVAFPGGRGTSHMVQIASERNLAVIDKRAT